MGVNASKAAGRTFVAAVRGKRVLARGRTVINRLAQCQTCDQALPTPEKPQLLRCVQCGCWLNGTHPTKSKVKLATERCPLGKWEAES
jgi:hypothetical protein